MPAVVELATHPGDRAGLGRDRRGVGVALAVLPSLDQLALLGEERMLLDVRDTDVVAFAGLRAHMKIHAADLQSKIASIK